MSRASPCHLLLVAVVCCLGLARPAHGQIVEWTEIIHDLDPATVPPLAQGAAVGGFALVINPGPTLASNAPALAAFNRAAQQWEGAISDPITVTVGADMANLGSPTVIGQASSFILNCSYACIRDPMVAAADADDGILASLPKAVQFDAVIPGGTVLTGELRANKSALKAIGGFGDLDAQFGTTDATITFNTQFSFDFDNSDGVGGGLIDFETVAAHELGHALGFTSVVDSVDAGAVSITPHVLDLFRFEDGSADDPTSPPSFRQASRQLTAGGSPITDFITSVGLEAAENLMSTGVNTGDGRQASHWKDNGLTGVLIGIMDPTLAFGAIVPITDADLRVLDLIGYDILFFDCSGVNNCSGNGTCTAPDICACDVGWSGADCSIPDCSGVNSCSGNGTCTAPDICACDAGWTGADCSVPDPAPVPALTSKGLMALALLLGLAGALRLAIMDEAVPSGNSPARTPLI